jgi:hypothetical protein
MVSVTSLPRSASSSPVSGSATSDARTCRVSAHRGRLVLVVAQVDAGVAGEDRDGVDPRPAQRLEQVERELVALLGQRLPLLVLGVGHVGGEQRAEDLAALLARLEVPRDVELLLGVEELEDL